MEYRPGLPEHNDNISHEHPLKDFGALLVALIALVAVVYFVLGLLVDFSVARISPEREAAWFKDSLLSKNIRESLSEGRALKPFEPEGFEALKRCAGIAVPTSLFVNESERINAVAIPGGDIIVYRGLIDSLSSQNGLDFVLAHELGHFKHRDHLRSMGRGIVLITGLSLLSGGNSSVLNMVSSLAGFEQVRFSQNRESDADASALEVLNCRYGHVGGAKEFFESVYKEKTLVEQVSHYFSTHPEVGDRIHALDKLINELGYAENAVVPLAE